VQLSQQQQAANDATQALASRDEELQQIKASNTTEVQAWHVKAAELKEVRSQLRWQYGTNASRFCGFGWEEVETDPGLLGVSSCFWQTEQKPGCAVCG
jgi:hypothetical protein